MNMQAIRDDLDVIRKDISEIKESISHLPRKKLPLPTGYNPLGKKRCISHKLMGGLMDPEIRASIIRLRREGQPFKNIAAYIKKHWPGRPEKHPSRSAIHRFCVAARNGRLREFGIEGE